MTIPTGSENMSRQGREQCLRSCGAAVSPQYFPVILEDALVKGLAYMEAREVTQGVQQGLDSLDIALMLGFNEDTHHPG